MTASEIASRYSEEVAAAVAERTLLKSCMKSPTTSYSDAAGGAPRITARRFSGSSYTYSRRLVSLHGWPLWLLRELQG